MRQETGTEHVAIATSKCVPSGIILRVQHLCRVPIALVHYRQRYSWVFVAPLYSHNQWHHQWLNLYNRKTWNTSETKKDITKRKTPFYSSLKSLLNDHIFGMTYFSGHMHFNGSLWSRQFQFNNFFTNFWTILYCLSSDLYRHTALKTVNTRFKFFAISISWAKTSLFSV